jgi:hypothetical protein
MRVVQELKMALHSAQYADLEGLTATLNSRLGSQARLSTATAFAWLCGGAAIAIVLFGGGLAVAFVGYSHMISVEPAVENTAKAFAHALEHAPLRTIISGDVSLAPGSEIRLADGQTVKLQEGAVITLDPASSVKVVGDLKIDVPQPSKEQLQAGTTSQSNDVPITDYTIFHGESYGSGNVVSGWSYDLSDTIRPKFEYCYYTQNIERGLATKYLLAINGSVRQSTHLPNSSFDVAGAAANCVWFSGF